jgi:hypothetical protein
MLVGGGLLSRPRTYDPVHVNAEFATQVSDHDPQVAAFTLAPTADTLCAMLEGWTKNAGVANSLCTKLRHGQIDAFDHEVDAQTAKDLTIEQAGLLERLAARV